MLTIKFTYPKQIFDQKGFDREIVAGLNRVNTAIVQDWNAITNTWSAEDKPTVKVTQARKSGSLYRASTEIDDPLFVGLNNGILQHEINAVNYPVLIFQENYNRKTTPRIVGSWQNGYSGKWVRKQSVTHPGVEPGNWDQAIAAAHRKALLDMVRWAIHIGVIRSV